MFPRRLHMLNLALLPVLLPLLLSGCGYRLAGSDSGLSSIGQIDLVAERGYAVVDSPMVVRLRERLRAAGVDITQAAPLKLRVSPVAEQRRILSVDANGRAIEHELVATVRWRLASEARVIVANDALTARRELGFDPEAVLASELEEVSHREAMQRELADRLVMLLPIRLSAPIDEEATAPVAEPAR